MIGAATATAAATGYWLPLLLFWMTVLICTANIQYRCVTPRTGQIERQKKQETLIKKTKIKSSITGKARAKHTHTSTNNKNQYLFLNENNNKYDYCSVFYVDNWIALSIFHPFQYASNFIIINITVVVFVVVIDAIVMVNLLSKYTRKPRKFNLQCEITFKTCAICHPIKAHSFKLKLKTINAFHFLLFLSFIHSHSTPISY